MHDNGAAALAAGILGCPVLETVNLHACSIGDAGARAMAAVTRARRRGPALHVYLTENKCAAPSLRSSVPRHPKPFVSVWFRQALSLCAN